MKGENFNKQDDVVVVNESVKKRGRGGAYNFPNAIDPASEDSETIRRVLSQTLYWFDRGEDRPTTDRGIFERSREFFQSCVENGERPTVEKYCLALGYARSTVNEWKNGAGHCSAERTNIIKKAFDSFAAFDAGMANDGKMNPVLYFFRAKNYYDMRDQQELVISPNSPLDSTATAQDVATKYAELPED